MLKSNARGSLRVKVALPAVLVSVALACSLGAGSARADEAVRTDEGEEVAIEAVAEEAAKRRERRQPGSTPASRWTARTTASAPSTTRRATSRARAW